MTDSRSELRQYITMLGDAGSRDSIPSKLPRFGESAVEPLLAALGEADENVRYGAAWVIGRLRSSALGAALIPLALEPLIDLLHTDETARVRLQALTTLMAIAGDADREKLVEPLIQALADSYEPIRAEAARWLGQIRDRRAVEPLSQLMANDSAEKVRGRAAYALAFIDSELEALRATGAVGLDALLSALKDNERSVRLRAIWALGELKVNQAVRPLLAVLEGSGNYQEKRKAAEALGQIGDRSAVDALLLALQFDLHEGVRSSAAEALGMLNDARVLNSLTRSLLTDAHPAVRASVARALAAMGDQAAVDALVQALRDSSSDVRYRAAEALGVLGDARAVEPLRELINDPHTSKHARTAAAQALAAIS